ncbi:MAG: phosphate ABC transporter substrate-binding protein [Deltaproteobacteria bacterium]|nr:MAG: phosphate ABC transporter substrate-binding protein [Deltaproteobacteria bacterium]
MSSKSHFKSKTFLVICLTLAFSILQTGCGQKTEEATTSPSGKAVIQNMGSDTMVNLAQAWAEEYAKINSLVSVEVSGGGSGTGIAALINGTVDIANCSRQMKAEEIARAKKNTGQEPQQFVVGYDALAVYIHKDNPLDQITVEQLADIYGEGGKLTRWSQLGINNAACVNDEIIRVSRQSNSGTYHYFREALLGKQRDFKLGSRDLHGSKDVVELVERTPCAIGYSGMGYATERVKKLKVAKKSGDPVYGPSVETALNGTYPIARPLYMYSLGEPAGEVNKYLEWIYSDVGQGIVQQSGYVPLPKQERVMAKKQ